jgi:RNA methyltransferase, TrmH family
MISKSKIKLIHSLTLKKFRNETHLFVAEGPKVVGDLYPYFDCEYIAATKDWLDTNRVPLPSMWDEVSQEELCKASLLQHPQQVIALFKYPEIGVLDKNMVRENLCLALDDVQDPGNLGTIVRLADWFGVEDIFCSLNTADVFSPKTVQATMGAIARVKMHYCSLEELFSSLDSDIPIYGTFLNGQNIYNTELSQHGLIVMGNEGNGISERIEKLVTQRLYIPSYPAGRTTSESLNVAIATAVVCSEFRRQAR